MGAIEMRENFGKTVFRDSTVSVDRANHRINTGDLVVGLGRLELPTSPLSGARSSHLSYRPLRHGRNRDNLTSLRCITANRNR
jgi:hypothetical protein